MTRTDMPSTWDERASLTTFLDYVRKTALAKCEDVSPDGARQAPLPGSPLMSLCGLISHLHWVEYYWFEVVLLGHDDEGPWTEEDPDREMRIAVDVPLAELLAAYEAQSERYRQLVAETDLEATAKRPIRDGRYPNLRWIMLHLIEEIARHNGHLDIMRELVDGKTGV